ncbi:ArsR/SmtB family transcription factor, partial [Janibacter hoylei]|uniref:ArsR/SmtB family transcription factor n=1 Tax=Janibacter hoylei TaxID=364298 RepID=UPI002882F430
WGRGAQRAVVTRLTVGDATVNDLAAPYDISLQAVSKHLKVLEEAGLVSRRKEAQRRPVHLESGALATMTGWIERHQRRPRSAWHASRRSWRTSLRPITAARAQEQTDEHHAQHHRPHHHRDHRG